MSPDGYCQECGHRRVPGRDRVELDLGVAAAITDRGSCRKRNEDAAGIGRSGQILAGIVCDGVGSSCRADDAAHAAVDTAIVSLIRTLACGQSPEEATRSAFDQAQSAVVTLGERLDECRGSTPSCTYVSAVVEASTVTLCWVGDSRAYWVPAEPGVPPICLTVDDSLAGQLAQAGVDLGPEIGAHGLALTRWLGADAESVLPHLSQVRLASAGWVVVCSDGLSRYLGADPDLELAVVAEGSPSVTARRLAQLALDAGGQDNVTVVVLTVSKCETWG
jgi:PPM family protein phosphatase